MAPELKPIKVKSPLELVGMDLIGKEYDMIFLDAVFSFLFA